MDKFTIAAFAASAALIGISAIAAWSPAARNPPLGRTFSRRSAGR